MQGALSRREVSAIPGALAGALVLAVGMGFGRFSFTGMYPLMVQEKLLSVAGGALAASVNYLGYLAGALLLSRVHPRHAAALCKAALAGTVLCLAALSFNFGLPYVTAVRFLAGLFSALAMVNGTTWLLQVVGDHHGAPLLFSGVGAGILASAELIAGGGGAGLRSAGLWGLLAAGAAALSAVAWPRLGRGESARTEESTARDAMPGGEPLPAWVIIPVYGLAGFGYIVTATYLPLFVRNALGGVDPVQVWAAFGLGAAPSCFLWHTLHHRLGSRRALALNLAVQAAGVMLPVLSASAPAFLGSAVLVGGTFVGTVTIAMTAAKRIAAGLRYNIVAAATSAYGLGQVAGPLLSNALLARTGSYAPPLLAAGGGLLLAALSCALRRRHAPAPTPPPPTR